MYFCHMIIVTGAAGFIGSCLVSKLNDLGQTNLLLVDDFLDAEKNRLLELKGFGEKTIEKISVIIEEKISSLEAEDADTNLEQVTE